MRKNLSIILILLSLAACSRDNTLYIVSTGDVHGAAFRKPYIEGENTKNSLLSVKHYVDSLRHHYGKNNVLLLDVGDCLQGNNSTYYFNYVDTEGEHLFSRIADYMDYDAVIMGNHDIETGHEVYDKVAKELNKAGVAVLGGNIVNASDSKPYFPVYKKFKKAGKDIIVFGFSNAAIKTWLSEYLWSGLDFISLTSEYVQAQIDAVLKNEKADYVIVALHSGTGDLENEVLENQSLRLLHELKNVDLIICGHDHKKAIIEHNGVYLVNSANTARTISFVSVSSERTTVKMVDLDKERIDKKMEEVFDADYQKVKAFTNQKIGNINVELRSRDAFVGMSDYINLVHMVMLRAKEAKISFAAPLSANGVVKSGDVIFNDLFTIYQYENQLYVLNLKGKEIKDYLEYSYNLWIQSDPNHILNIKYEDNRWLFVNPSFNFDSAAGLIYTVDPLKPYGSRVNIISLADGSKFEHNAIYPVAMTSYRANGGGDLLINGANIPKDIIPSRIIARYSDIRNMVGDFIRENGNIDSALLSNPDILGKWHFVPQKEIEEKIADDLRYLYR